MPALAILRHDLRNLAASWLVRLWLVASAVLTLFLFPPFVNKSLTYYDGLHRDTHFILSKPSPSIAGYRLATEWAVHWERLLAIEIPIVVASGGLTYVIVSFVIRKPAREILTNTCA